jgi:hypothetical protein
METIGAEQWFMSVDTYCPSPLLTFGKGSGTSRWQEIASSSPLFVSFTFMDSMSVMSWHDNGGLPLFPRTQREKNVLSSEPFRPLVYTSQVCIRMCLYR